MNTLEINMLGEIKIFWNKKNVTENLSVKGIGILCLLAVEPEKLQSREKMTQYFWSQSNDDAARYNLRYSLWSIRKILKIDDQESIIVSIKDKCKLNSKTKVRTDIFKVENLLKDLDEKNQKDYIKNLEYAKDLFSGEFLESIYLKNCMEFNDWVFFMREKYQRMYLDILNKLSAAYRNKKNYSKAIETLEIMIRLNPLQEESYVKVIEIYLEMGDKKAALHQYTKCVNILRDELNVSPRESTKIMYKKIMEQDQNQYKEQDHIKNNLITLPHTKMIYSEDTNFESLRKRFFHSYEGIELYTRCYPVKNLDYYWIHELLDTILEKKDELNLNEFSKGYWLDLIMIHRGVEIYIDHEIFLDSIKELEKIRIFSAMNKLLNYLHKNNKLILWIENFHWIDHTSFEFLKYFSLKNIDYNGIFVISGDEKDEKLEILNQLIQFEKY